MAGGKGFQLVGIGQADHLHALDRLQRGQVPLEQGDVRGTAEPQDAERFAVGEWRARRRDGVIVDGVGDDLHRGNAVVAAETLRVHLGVGDDHVDQTQQAEQRRRRDVIPERAPATTAH